MPLHFRTLWCYTNFIIIYLLLSLLLFYYYYYYYYYYTKRFANEVELIDVGSSRPQRLSCHQLSIDTSNGPRVHRWSILSVADQQLWCSIPARCYVVCVVITGAGCQRSQRHFDNDMVDIIIIIIIIITERFIVAKIISIISMTT